MTNKLNPSEVDITFYPVANSGFGYPVIGARCTHLPTGLYVISHTERSVHANRNKAWDDLQDLVHPTPAAEQKVVTDIQARLLKNLKLEQYILERLILRVPTGAARNALCDANIHLLSAISHLPKAPASPANPSGL